MTGSLSLPCSVSLHPRDYVYGVSNVNHILNSTAYRSAGLFAGGKGETVEEMAYAMATGRIGVGKVEVYLKVRPILLVYRPGKLLLTFAVNVHLIRVLLRNCRRPQDVYPMVISPHLRDRNL